MTWSKYEKYDKGKMLGGIYKKGRLKGQEEVIDTLNDLLKVNDKFNLKTITNQINKVIDQQETITNQINKVIDQQKNLSQRLSIIEQKLGIQQQTS